MPEARRGNLSAAKAGHYAPGGRLRRAAAFQLKGTYESCQ